MMDPISMQKIQGGQGIQMPQIVEKSGKSGSGFGDMVEGFAKEMNDVQNRASQQVADLAAGKVDNVHNVMIELGKSEVTFGYMMEVRNKLIDAYKEVMRMQM
jgi:flagellar hook-basal body complex protein FliE